MARITQTSLKLKEVKYINYEQLESANTSFDRCYGICLRNDGSIIMSGEKPYANNCFLKCIRNGAKVWEVNTRQKEEVYGLCCVNRKKEYLINTLGRRLEVRDVTDGRLLQGCDVDFDPGRMCSTEEEFLFVRNSSVTPRTLVKFKLVEQQQGVILEKNNETLNTKMDGVNDLTMLSYDEIKLIILVDQSTNTIRAINYETGAIVWKIVKERIDGKIIRPHGVCHDDVGHLFVADYTNKRVLVVSPDGKIKQKLLDLPGSTRYIAFDVKQQKLIVQYEKGNERVLNIYDIEYITE